MKKCRNNIQITLTAFILVVLFSPPQVDAGQNFDRRTPLVIAVEKVGPAVVNINTEEAPRQARNPFRGFLGDDLFKRYFKEFSPPNRRGKRSLGSGVIIDPRGYILTNEHVIARAQSIKITLIDKREFTATLIGADKKSDLAIIKITPDKNLPFVKMSRSNDLMIGETVLAIGNPFGLQHTVTTGIISALNRSLPVSKGKSLSGFIQVDVPINPGNSGGPLLNINGSLIGINTAIHQNAEGIGFAIPIDKAKRIVNDLIEYGQVRRGWLGVSVQDLNEDLVKMFKLTHNYGVLINKVFKNSPMEKSNFRQGDILVSIDGQEIADKSSYQDKIASYPINDVVQFGFIRDGRHRKARALVSEIPKNYANELSRDWLGLEVKTLTKELARHYRISASEGVVVIATVPKSESDKIGIRQGDVIRQVNKNSIKNENDFQKALLEAGKLSSILLLVQRGRSGYYVTLEP
ncbi:MAG: Do family serine endopeptidase [Nitrospinales bacterium]